MIPNGDPLCVRLADGTTHHSPPFLVETMTEDQVRMFLKTKDPMVFIEDDADDEAAYRAGAAVLPQLLTLMIQMLHLEIMMPQVRRRIHVRMPEVSEIMDSSTTTVITTSEDSEENYPSEQFYD
eukprot:6078597-Amphidinium_carterae.1